MLLLARTVVRGKNQHDARTRLNPPDGFEVRAQADVRRQTVLARLPLFSPVAPDNSSTGISLSTPGSGRIWCGMV